MRANVRIDRLAVPGLPPLSAVKAEIQVEPDRLVVEPLSLAVAGGQLQGRLELAARRGEPLRVKLRAQGDGLSLQTLDAVSSGDDRVRGGRVNLRANLELAGRTPHGLASSANGSVLVSVADATVLGSAAVMERDILVTVMKALLPRQEVDQSLKVECAVVNLPLRNGVASIDRSIAMETDKLAVAASGELNLVAQTVALTFRPAAKKGLGLDPANLASMAMLEGPLHDPKVGHRHEGHRARGRQHRRCGRHRGADVGGQTIVVGARRDPGVSSARWRARPRLERARLAPELEREAQSPHPVAGAGQARSAEVDARLLAQSDAQADAGEDFIERVKALGQQREAVVERPLAGDAQALGGAAVAEAIRHPGCRGLRAFR